MIGGNQPDRFTQTVALAIIKIGFGVNTYMIHYIGHAYAKVSAIYTTIAAGIIYTHSQNVFLIP